MKKLSAIVLAIMLALCACTACAQEIVPGESLALAEALYESPNGFMLMYPADGFSITEQYGNDLIVPVDAALEGISVMVVPVDIPVEEAEGFIYEATGGYMEGEAVISEITGWQLASGMDVKHVQAEMAEEFHRYFLITGFDSVFCVTMIYPVGIAEETVTSLENIIASFAVITSE